jgi:hypothetical protein
MEEGLSGLFGRSVYLVIARNVVTKQSRFREIATDFVLATFGIATPRAARLAMTTFVLPRCGRRG